MSIRLATLIIAACALTAAARAHDDSPFARAVAAAQSNKLDQARAFYQSADEQGDARGAFGLGLLSLRGAGGLPRDDAQAARYFLKAAEHGDMNAQFFLFACSLLGLGIPQDFAKAEQWLIKTYSHGASFHFNQLYAVGLKPALIAAIDGALTKAAIDNDPVAQTVLGFCYSYGFAVNVDRIQGMDWLIKAARSGEAHAQHLVAFILGQGTQSVSPDKEHAVEWLRKAADQGFVGSIYMLGYDYYYGEGVDKDRDRGIALIRQAAGSGLPSAQYKLAELYRAGTDMPQDFAVALDYFRQSAAQGNALADYALAAMAKRGQGMEADGEQAVAWLRKAAHMNVADAQTALGFALYRGEGTEKDSAEAAEWLRRAADSGNVQAQYLIGTLLCRGDGAPLNMDAAEKWFELAVKNGDKKAAAALEKLRRNPPECNSVEADDGIL